VVGGSVGSPRWASTSQIAFRSRIAARTRRGPELAQWRARGFIRARTTAKSADSTRTSSCRLEAAIDAQRRAVEMARAVGADGQRTAALWTTLAELCDAAGRTADAEAARTEARAAQSGR
jgi:hypothetical protein